MIEQRAEFVAAIALIGLAACYPRPPYQLQTLPSGKQIKILGIGRVYGQQEGGWAIVLKYETDLDITDIPALRSEVMEIWQEFRINADRSGLSLAAINANESPKGMFITTNRSHGFAFKKKASGEWSALEEPAGER